MASFNPGGAASLNEATKLRLEANPDTNTVTDAEKTSISTAVQPADIENVVRSDPATYGGEAIESFGTISKSEYDARVANGDVLGTYLIYEDV